jgi:hypothetical protein
MSSARCCASVAAPADMRRSPSGRGPGIEGLLSRDAAWPRDARAPVVWKHLLAARGTCAPWVAR